MEKLYYISCISDYIEHEQLSSQFHPFIVSLYQILEYVYIYIYAHTYLCSFAVSVLTALQLLLSQCKLKQSWKTPWKARSIIIVAMQLMYRMFAHMTDKHLGYRLNKQEVYVQRINEVYTLHVWYWCKEDVETTSENEELESEWLFHI